MKGNKRPRDRDYISRCIHKHSLVGIVYVYVCNDTRHTSHSLSQARPASQPSQRVILMHFNRWVCKRCGIEGNKVDGRCGEVCRVEWLEGQKKRNNKYTKLNVDESRARDFIQKNVFFCCYSSAYEEYIYTYICYWKWTPLPSNPFTSSQSVSHQAVIIIIVIDICDIQICSHLFACLGSRFWLSFAAELREGKPSRARPGHDKPMRMGTRTTSQSSFIHSIHAFLISRVKEEVGTYYNIIYQTNSFIVFRFILLFLLLLSSSLLLLLLSSQCYSQHNYVVFFYKLNFFVIKYQ